MTETPDYTVLKKQDALEIRLYPTYIQAAVTMDEKSYNDAMQRGFDVLAGYIFGKNVSQQKIEMTTPVQATRSEKIAMTSPVTVTGGSDYSVAFIMPAQYTLDTLPTPQDERIHFTQIPARQMAVMRFSGHFQQESIEKHQQQLSAWLDGQGMHATGNFTAARYNPPWVPFFLTRNEVMIEVETSQEDA